jgi:hypothetical protein
MLNQMAGIGLLPVAYKGESPSLVDLMGGQVDLVVTTLASAAGPLQGGKIGVIATTTAARAKAMPELKTVAESGFPGYEMEGWGGIFVPPGTPKEIVERLHREIARILYSDEMRDALVKRGSESVGNTPEQFGAYIRTQSDRIGKLVKTSMSARTEARGACAIDFRVRPPAGNFPNIDIFPKLWQERSANWGWYSALPASVTTRSLPLLLDEMKACNVVHGVVWGRADLLPEQSVPHEDVAAILAANPEVFVAGFGGITLQGGIRKAVAEVERARALGLKGVTVEPGWSGMPDKRADDAALYPIYEACQELDLILAMTSGARMGPDISCTLT